MHVLRWNIDPGGSVTRHQQDMALAD